MSACPACGARYVASHSRTSGTCLPEGEGQRPLLEAAWFQVQSNTHVPFLFGEVVLVVVCIHLFQRACLGVRAACVPCSPTLCVRGDHGHFGLWDLVTRGEQPHQRPTRPRREAGRAAAAARGGAELGSGDTTEPRARSRKRRLHSGQRPLRTRGPRDKAKTDVRRAGERARSERRPRT